MTAGLPAYAQVQEASEGEAYPYGTGIGLEILLTNSGFGLGGYYRQSMYKATSVLVEINIGAGKDEREIGLSNIYGQRIIPGKANYLLMLPLQGGIQQRLFRNQIEDNFRPYLQISGGPTLGWEYPYFDDRNQNGEFNSESESRYNYLSGLIKGDVHLGVGGFIGLGAHFGRSQQVARGIRIGYRFDYFSEGIYLLEPAHHEAQQFFGSPTVSLTFGRLLFQ